MSNGGDVIPTAAVPVLDDTFGAMLISIILASSLWGVGTTQAYWYYNTYWCKDTRYLKLYVLMVWIFDTVNQALMIHLIYYFLIQNYFNPVALDHYIWSLNFQSFFESLTCLSVQLFFVRRIWILSQRDYIRTAIPMVCVLAKLGIGLAYTIKSASLKSITVAFSKIHTLTISINGVAAAADIAIALTMVHLLYSSRSEIPASYNLIKRLMTYTVSTGAITSVCAVLTLILGLSFPKNFLFSAFYFLTAKLYFNTMLASLNARNFLSHMRNKALRSEHTNGFELVATQSQKTADSTHSTFIAAPNPSKENMMSMA